MSIKYIAVCIMSCAILSFPALSEEVPVETSDRNEKGMAMAGKLFPGLDPDALALPEKFRKYTIEHLFGDVCHGTVRHPMSALTHAGVTLHATLAAVQALCEPKD